MRFLINWNYTSTYIILTVHTGKQKLLKVTKDFTKSVGGYRDKVSFGGHIRKCNKYLSRNAVFKKGKKPPS